MSEFKPFAEFKPYATRQEFRVDGTLGGVVLTKHEVPRERSPKVPVMYSIRNENRSEGEAIWFSPEDAAALCTLLRAWGVQ